VLAQLKVVQGGLPGAQIALQGPTVMIGHSPRCQVRPAGPSVASEHCEVVVGEGYVAVRDLGSPGGTLLNGLRMAPDCLATARPGDRITVGGSVYEVGFRNDERGDPDSAAATAERLLQQRLGARRRLSRGETRLVSTRDLAGIPVHTIGLWSITDPPTTRAWRAILNDLSSRPGVGRLVLDLRAVEACSEEAVDALLAFRRRIEAEGSVVKLCDVRPSVLAVLRQAGADRLIEVYQDASEAVWSRW
jgi:anti-anti-sigma regulatory factor